MLIGISRETLPGENRVALTPEAASELIGKGMEVAVEVGAGEAAGFGDGAYSERGVEVVAARPALFERADVIVQVQTYGANPQGGGDLELFRTDCTLIGFAEPLGSDDEVPSIDRFFIGGASTIRGFSTRELGPGGGSGEFSEGAEFYIIFNQELRIPIYGRFWGELFFDAGNGWRGLDDPNISFNGAAYSYGIGAQYHSPAGPLRLDYARRVRTKGITNIPGPDDRFHFTILYAF